MAPDDLRTLRRRQPFLPFRLIMTNGDTYDVVGPEWMMVTRRSTVVGHPGKTGAGDILNWLDNDQIAGAKPLEAEPMQ